MTSGKPSDLKVTLPSDREIVMTRVFDAPRALVFKAHTDPALIPKWWTRRDNTTIVDQMDVRPGGAWRFIQRTPDGSEFAFRGEFREVVPPERLVYTFEFELMAGHIFLETLTFAETNGKTTLTARALFDSVGDRDRNLDSGMEAGAAETYDRLAELLATLA